MKNTVSTTIKNANGELIKIYVKAESGIYSVYLENGMNLMTGFQTIEEAVSHSKKYLATSIITINN